MTWKDLQEQWKRTAVTPLSASTAQDALRRAQRLQRLIFWRDGAESAAALVLLPFVIIWLRDAVRAHLILSQASAVLLLGWLFYVPWSLWRARRLLPRNDPGLPLLRYLEMERQAMLAQARLLERAAWWYIAPCALGITGLNLGNYGPTRGVLIYLAMMLVLCVLIERLNKQKAKSIFRRRIADIDATCRELTALEAAPDDTHTTRENRDEP